MIADHLQKWPTRLVARQVSELLLARGRRWQRLVPSDGLSGMVFEVVLSASIAHHPYRDPDSGRWIGIEDAGTLGRSVTATAVANSMGLPQTTVRRRAAELVRADILVRDKAGFRVAPRFFVDGGLALIAAEDAGDLHRALAALARAGFQPARDAIEAGLATLPPGVVERLLLAFALRAMETFTALYGDVVAGAIATTIVAANVHPVTEDPELSRYYAAEDLPPPDALRVPIAMRALSRAMGLPFETVRRRVNALIAEHVVVRKGEGVMVPTAVLLDERHIDNNRRILFHFEQTLGALVSLAGNAQPG